MNSYEAGELEFSKSLLLMAEKQIQAGEYLEAESSARFAITGFDLAKVDEALLDQALVGTRDAYSMIVNARSLMAKTGQAEALKQSDKNRDASRRADASRMFDEFDNGLKDAARTAIAEVRAKRQASA